MIRGRARTRRLGHGSDSASALSATRAHRSALNDSRLIELAVAIGLAAIVAAVAIPAWLFLAATPADAHPVNRLLNACQEGARRGSLAVVGFTACGILLAWATIAVIRLVHRIARDGPALRRMSRALQATSEPAELCLKGKAVTVHLLADDGLVAFTAGLLRPRIYASRALLTRLSRAECDGVLLHEAAHARRYDPLRCWLVELAMSSIWWRAFGHVDGQYRATCEAEADLAAVGVLGDDRPLLRALRKVDALESVPGACCLTNERERALRDVRECGTRMTSAQRLRLLAAIGVLTGVIVLTVAGLSDWQLYWFCPYGTAAMA